MSAIAKYWFAVGFWHKKEKSYTPPAQEEIDYIKEITDYKVNIQEEYDKGYKAG